MPAAQPIARSSTARSGTIDALRGLAALAVVWYHATAPFGGGLGTSGAYGWAGVEVFFVISGFVIPYSLYRSGYTFSDAPRFLFKRVLRLHPPYLASIVFTLAVAWLASISPGFRGAPFELSGWSLLLHFFYLNDLFGVSWVNPVYWTLAIEMQFYLVIALAQPWLASDEQRRYWPAILGLAAVPMVYHPQFVVVTYLPIFLAGTITFKHAVGQIRFAPFVAGLALLILMVYATQGAFIAGVTVATAAVIMFRQRPIPLLARLGAVSYALYLVHYPIVLRVDNLGRRVVTGEAGELLIAIAAVAVSIGAGTLFYLVVERPVHRWSTAIPLRHPRALENTSLSETMQ